MNNTTYQEFLRQLEEAKQRQERENTLARIKNYVSKINNVGGYLDKTGQFLKGHINNGIASGLQNTGNILQSGGQKILDTLNAPQNYFRGVAAKPFEALAAKIGSGAGAGIGSGAISNAVANGATGLGSTALGSSLMGATGGSAAGMGAAGATSALSGATSGATAAGTAGAAAGGSAAGGAAAAGPIGALVALGIMAAQGANRKRAKQAGEALMSSTNSLAQQANEDAFNDLMQTQQNTSALQQQAAENLSQGLPTGGAAGVSGQLPDLSQIAAQPSLQWGETNPNAPKLQPLNEVLVKYSNNPDIAAYQKSLLGQGISSDIINGVPQGLNGGNKDIAQWQQQYAEGNGRNVGFKIPQTEDDIALAQAGNFNNFAPEVEGVVSENVRNGLMNKFINGLTDLSKGYKENKENGFKPENLASDNSKNKMTRIGEAAGTISRAVQKPAVQALLAGALSTALTGNPLYGLGQAYKFGNARLMSDVYGKALKQYGIDTSETGLFGNYGSDDVKTLMYPQVEQMKNDRELTRLEQLNDYRTGQLENQRTKNEIAQKNAETNEYKAKNGTKVTHVSTGGGKKTSGGKTITSPSGQYVVGQTPNGKPVKVPVEEVKTFKSNGGKIVG